MHASKCWLNIVKKEELIQLIKCMFQLKYDAYNTLRTRVSLAVGLLIQEHLWPIWHRARTDYFENSHSNQEALLACGQARFKRRILNTLNFYYCAKPFWVLKKVNNPL